MKVALVISSLEQGGAQRQLCVLAEGLVRRGDEVVVVPGQPGGPFANRLAETAIPVVSYDKRNLPDLRYFVRLRRILNQQRPDVVACYLTDCNVFGGLYKLTAPRRKVLMGLRNDRPPIYTASGAARVLPIMEGLLSRVVDATVVNSRRGAQTARARGFPADRLYTIDNGIDIDAFRPASAEGEATRSEWQIDPSQILIGFVGRRHPAKAIDVLLPALREVADRVPAARFVLIGQTWKESHRRYLDALAASLALGPPLLRWLDTYPYMPGAYNAFDLLVSSSLQEGFANNIAEALACGTPCVVTDVGDSGRLVDDVDLVVPPGDGPALVAAVLRAIDTRLPADRQEIRAGVLQFSVDTMVDATRDLYAKLVGGGLQRADRSA